MLGVFLAGESGRTPVTRASGVVGVTGTLVLTWLAFTNRMQSSRVLMNVSQVGPNNEDASANACGKENTSYINLIFVTT